jgi:hypothetical protein
MLSIVIGILGLFAVVAWVVAVMSAIQIVRMAPAGEKLRTYGRLGWWKFDVIRQQIGDAVDLPIRSYQRAFVAFFICVLASIVIGGLLGVTAQN